MKFASKLDAQTFLLEIGADIEKVGKADENYVPTSEEMGNFIKKRSPLVDKVKNYRKSADSKKNWRKNRTKMMKGIKAFHKSTDGKRFHKRLGKFLATRITRQKDKKVTESSVYDVLMAKQGFLKGLNSAKQHCLVEMEYFHQLQEQVELEEFIFDYMYPYLHAIEHKMVSNEDLTEDEEVFLFDIVDETSFLQKLSETANMEFAQTEKVWNAIVSDLDKEGIAKSEANYYPILVDRLKTELGKK